MKVKVREDIIDLDTSKMDFNEASINDYLRTEASYYNYFYEKWVEASYVLSKIEDARTYAYNEAYRVNKESGMTDKSADAASSISEAVVKLDAQKLIAKRTKDLIWGHLRSWDRSHDNALNFCYNIRKELDKIYGTISKPNDCTDEQMLHQKVNNIIGH